MSKCRACGRPIVFKAHPQNPDKIAPFDPDGELHFVSCASKARTKKEYKALDEIMCAKCEQFAALVFIQPITGGERLAYLCDNLHKEWLPMTPGNLSLVNATWQQAQDLDRVKQARYGGAPLSRVRELVESYRATYGVKGDLGDFLARWS